jgi:phage terminase large subunit-like protein
MPSDRRGGAAKRLPDDSLGPWTRWKGTRHGKAIRFIQTYCASPKGEGFGKPLRLAPWQKEQLEAILADDVDAAVLSFPRGNGKSTFQAALAVWAAFMDTSTGAPQVPIIATTVGQAMRSVYNTAAAMVAHESELERRSIPFTGTGTSRIVVPSSGGELFPMANDVDGLQGLDPSLAIADEIGFQPVDSWGALLMAGGKRSRSLVLGMGTPGIDHDSALFRVRESIIAGNELARFHFREWAARDGCAIDDRAEWRVANPAIGAGFLRESALVTDLGLMPPARFRIFRLGQWVEGVESWLGDDGHAIWAATEEPYELVAGAPTWIGVDAAITRDTTAVVAVQVRDGERLHAVARFWVPKRDEPTDISDVMAHIRTLADRYKVGAVAYDPRFMDWPAKVLHDEGIPMVEISQSVDRMTPVIGDLYTLIRDGMVTHERDPMFAKHVLDAVPRHNERGFTLRKADSRGHIDACIALALAVAQYRGRKRPRSLYVG